MVQRPTCMWTGASGSQYVYRIYPIGTPMADLTGNYIYARLSHIDKDGVSIWQPVYIGQGNLADRSDLSSHHKSYCIRNAGATHFHAHTNAMRQDRVAEEADLLAGGAPRCNA